MTNEHKIDAAEQKAMFATPKDPGQNEGAPDQKTPYDELNDRLNKWRTKWRQRPSKWFTIPMEIAALAIGFLTFIAVVWAGIAAFKNISLLSKQADVAEEQLDLTDRPWLKVELALGGPFMRQQDSSVSLPLILTLKNVGRSVASGIDVEFALIPNQWGDAVFSLPMNEQRRLCTLAISRNAQTRRLAIFPSDGEREPMSSSLGADQMAEVAKTFGNRFGYASRDASGRRVRGLSVRRIAETSPDNVSLQRRPVRPTDARNSHAVRFCSHARNANRNHDLGQMVLWRQ